MIWGDSETIRIIAYDGNVGDDVLLDMDNIMPGDEISVSGMGGEPNNQYWEIFGSISGIKLGESTFHISCSDDDMNGSEDFGLLQGDGKGKTSYLNLWIFEGMAGELALDCSLASVELTDECEFEAPPPNCETMGKPQTLIFEYTGDDCTARNIYNDSLKTILHIEPYKT